MKKIIGKIENEILKITDFKKVLDEPFKKRKIENIYQLEKELPPEAVDKINLFMMFYIEPIVSDDFYYKFIFENFGNAQENGPLKPCSDLSCSVMTMLMHSHCIFLQSTCEKYFKKNFDVEF